MTAMRHMMNLMETLISEMPIVNYQTHGDFTKPGSFNDTNDLAPTSAVDRKHSLFRKDATVVSHPVSIAKMKRAFERTPFPFAFHMVNAPTDGDYWEQYSEYQMLDWTPALLAEKFGIQVTLDPKAINVVLLGNQANERDRMSGWILAHRFTHALWQRESEGATTTANLEQWYYNVRDRIRVLTDATVSDKELLTMRSAREDKLSEPGEEMVSQFIVTGKITLKRLGNPEADRLIASFEAKVNQTVAAALNHSVGKLFVWF